MPCELLYQDVFTQGKRAIVQVFLKGDIVIKILEADFSLPAHGKAIIQLMQEYAQGESGGGKALSRFVEENLIEALDQREMAHGILAFAGETPAGLIICLEGFSTFACRPLLNIHDVIVSEPFRGRGIAKQMLQKVEVLARQLNCCKLTLEVLEGNQAAKAVYWSVGFRGYELDPRMGKALFWEKKLET